MSLIVLYKGWEFLSISAYIIFFQRKMISDSLKWPIYCMFIFLIFMTRIHSLGQLMWIEQLNRKISKLHKSDETATDSGQDPGTPWEKYYRRVGRGLFLTQDALWVDLVSGWRRYFRKLCKKNPGKLNSLQVFDNENDKTELHKLEWQKIWEIRSLGVEKQVDLCRVLFMLL